MPTSADGSTQLTYLQIHTYYNSGPYTFSGPFSDIGVSLPGPNLTAQIQLDRPLLTDTGSVIELDYVSLYNHGAYPFYLQNAPSVSKIVDRGAYHVTAITITNTSDGTSTSYTAAQLDSLGLSAGFSFFDRLPGSVDQDNLADIVWQSRAGTISTSLADMVGGFHFDISGSFNGQPAGSATAQEAINTAGNSSAILFRNQDGGVSIWTGLNSITDGHGVTKTSIAAYTHASVGTQWNIAAASDFNADGISDLLWRNNDGSISTWTASSSSAGLGFIENSFYHGSVGASWTVEGAADFSGDGRADILWRNTDGSLSTWNSTSTTTTISFQENS